MRNAIIGNDGCATILHHNAGAIYPQIRQALGAGVLVHVRMYTPNWYALDAKQWAAECVEHLRAIPGLLDDPMVIITPANEQDLAAEGHPGAATEQYNNPTKEVYDYIWTWDTTWTIEFRRLAPTTPVKLFTAPLAGGHEPAGYPPDYEYQLATFAEYLSRCDGISAHGYCVANWTGHSPETGGYWAALRPLRPEGYRERDGTPKIHNLSDPGGLMVQHPEYPCLISEFGNWNHFDAGGAAVAATIEQYKVVYEAYSDSGRCIGITPFIWDTGDEHRYNRIRGNSALAQGLVGLPRYEGAGWNVTPIPTTAPVPDIFYLLLGPRASECHTSGTSADHLANGQHIAYDVAGMKHWPVYAVADGWVDFVTYESASHPRGRGHCLGVVHPSVRVGPNECLEVAPCHLAEKPLVVEGQKVKRGQLLGYTGWTGKVQPPNELGEHVHLVCYSVADNSLASPWAYIRPESLKIYITGG
jgi:murein DD-endopeptidase MepM/ murein hydrolase activator NlpD